MHDIFLHYGFWIVLGIVLLISEAVVPTAVILFFGFGALFTAILAATNLDLSLSMLLMLFSVFSVGSLLLLRKTCKQWLVGHNSDISDGKSSGSSMAGESAVVSTTFINHKGTVRLHGSTWNAACNENASLDEGDRVTIVSVQGNTLFVEKA